MTLADGTIVTRLPQAGAATVALKFGNPLHTAMGRTLLIAALALFCCPGVSLAAQQPPLSKPGVTPEIAKQFPDGPGKATFLRVCSTCHSPMNVMAAGHTEQGWEDTITKMAGYGASGSDEDFTAILEYLEKNYPPLPKVDINKASAPELETGLQLEPTLAEAIVAYRDKHGDFKTLQDVEQVPGVDAAILEAKKGRINFN